MRIYHGTSVENAERILKEGFSTENKNWYVSENDKAYFYYGEDDEELKMSAITNGCIAAALQHSNSTQIALLSIEIEEDIGEYQDCSCENMYEFSVELPFEYLQNKSLTVEYAENSFIPGLSLMYLVGLNMMYLNTNNLSETEIFLLQSPQFIDDSSQVQNYICG